MTHTPQLLLIGAVAAVGVLHTMVPDHWMPITLIARQHGWSRRETALAALQAGCGHVVSTLLIALAVWLAGVAFATRFGNLVDGATSLALIGLGGWIALSAIRELRSAEVEPSDAPANRTHTHGHLHAHPMAKADAKTSVYCPAGYAGESSHADSPRGDRLYLPLGGGLAVTASHAHLHRHDYGAQHAHWHDHDPGTLHVLASELGFIPLHDHRHRTPARVAMLIVLGSSPMVEGIPAFFAAAKFGAGLILVMAIVFGLCTIATYVLLCVYSAAGLQHIRLGAVERYGEVLSGALITLIGLIFLLFPVL
jgi:ABC-type nickel/cobalt efflux system permease component RcnA